MGGMSMLLTGCLDKEYSKTEISSDARLKAFFFKAEDSIPGLGAAVFTIDEAAGKVFNPDSLPFKTPIDRVRPSVQLASTAGSIMFVGQDTVHLTGTDTIDFRVQPVRLRNYASDGVSMKEYDIYVNVHQVEPELYDWRQLLSAVYSHDALSQKVILVDDKFYLFVNNGVGNTLHLSTDARTWEQKDVIGLPQHMDFRQVVWLANNFYVVADGVLYTSSDGCQWSACKAEGHTFVSLLFVFNGSMWAVAQEGESTALRFASSTDGNSWQLTSEVPATFPLADYAALAFTARTGKPKAIVMGGISADGTIRDTRWTTENGTEWIDLSMDKLPFGSLAGASLIHYDDKLLLFGGVDADNQVMAVQIWQSVDEGMHWTQPNPEYNSFPEAYKARTGQTVCVDKNKFIYIIGGRTRTEVLSDVWRGKLNRMDFKD